MSRIPLFLFCLLVIGSSIAELIKNSIERDSFGVERTFERFTRLPQLEQYILRDLKRNRMLSPLSHAVALNNKDLQVNEMLKNAWNLGNKMRPEYASDPLKMAAFVYSLSDPSFNPIYQEFNDAVAAFKSNSSYEDFHYKGMYALLKLSARPYDHDLYRGISATMAAEKDMFIRFNRFQSTSTNLTASMIYAKKRGVPGTLLVFKGVKNAAYIDPYSYYPDEDEHLIEPKTQFKVLEVVDGPITDMNPGRRVVLKRVNYP